MMRRGKACQHGRFEHPHVARQDNEIDAKTSQSLNQILLALRGETRLETGFLQPRGGNTGIARQFQNPGVGDIRTNENDTGIEPAGPNRFVNGAEVRSLARAEHTEAELMHREPGTCPPRLDIASDASQWSVSVQDAPVARQYQDDEKRRSPTRVGQAT